MKRKVRSYIEKSSENYFKEEIDYYDILEMFEAGLDDKDIAREIGVDKSYVINLINEIKKDF